MKVLSRLKYSGEMIFIGHFKFQFALQLNQMVLLCPVLFAA